MGIYKKIAINNHLFTKNSTEMNLDNKTLIFCCQVYYPDEQSTSQLFTAVMERLVSKGHPVTVLCGFPNDVMQKKIPKCQTHNGVVIERLGLRLSLKKSYVSRGLSYISYLIGVIPKLLFAPRGAQFFAVTNPPFLAWILALISFMRGHSFTFMFLDLHPEGLIALGNFSESVWYVRLWKYLNGIAYRRAKKLLVLGRDMIPVLSDSYGLDPTSFSYVPHWSASENEGPIPFASAKFSKIWGVSDFFVVQYSGNMGLWHDIDTFVRAAKELEAYKKIKFIFVGGGIRKFKAMILAEKLGVKNIRWEEFVSIEDLTQSLASCHLALISLNKNLEGVAVPCKLYGILASGRGVIAQVPEASEVALTVNENNCGLVVAPQDVSGLAKVILELSENLPETERMGKASYDAYLNNYQINNAVDSFEEILFKH